MIAFIVYLQLQFILNVCFRTRACEPLRPHPFHVASNLVRREGSPPSLRSRTRRKGVPSNRSNTYVMSYVTGKKRNNDENNYARGKNILALLPKTNTETWPYKIVSPSQTVISFILSIAMAQTRERTRFLYQYQVIMIIPRTVHCTGDRMP